MKKWKKKRLEEAQSPAAQIARFEQQTGCKVIDLEKGIIEYEGKQWRPITSNSELLCASWDGEPMISVNKQYFVGVGWKA